MLEGPNLPLEPRGHTALLTVNERGWRRRATPCASPSWATCSSAWGGRGLTFLYDGDVGRAVSQWVLERGGRLSEEDLASYEVVEREPSVREIRGP